MNNIANCKNGKTRLISVDHCFKTVDSARVETKLKNKIFCFIGYHGDRRMNKIGIAYSPYGSHMQCPICKRLI